MHKTIFIVDDSNTNLLVARDALCNDYKVITLSSAAKMFALLKKIKPDLILLDIEMPGMNGLEALKLLKSDVSTMDIPVIFLTVMNDPDIEASGFKLGVVDFLIKPFSKPVLLSRIKSHLDIDELIRKQTAQLELLQSSTVLVMANIIEKRDKKTGGHVSRTTAYIKLLVDAMLAKGLYNEVFSNIDIDSFISSARLHDVGKITIADAILNKPDKLLDEEFEIMKKHTTTGEKIIDEIIAMTGDIIFLQNAKLFAGYHHEWWDGSGYPYNVERDDIPFQGRIMSIVDVYDALVCERPYKDAIPHKKAVEIIMNNAKTQFDPEIANIFFKVKDQFEEISLRI